MIILINKNSKALFFISVIAIFLIVSFYIYFVSLTMIEIVNRNKNETTFQSINLEYQKIEERYFELLENLNLDQAYSLGFIDEKKSGFAVRQTTVARR